MYSKFSKRFLDILISVIGLPVFVLIYVFIGLLIKLQDRGPIFYNADRIGKDSKTFKMYKFRTMKVNAPILFNRRW